MPIYELTKVDITKVASFRSSQASIFGVMLNMSRRTDQARLYELIWIRTIASQMESAELERTTVDIAAKAGSRVLELRATGQVIKFDGFLALYQEGRDDDGDDEDSRRLPAMSEGEALKRRRSPSPSISPSRRRASRKPRWSSAWKSSASAGPRPTPRSCRC